MNDGAIIAQMIRPVWKTGHKTNKIPRSEAGYFVVLQTVRSPNSFWDFSTGIARKRSQAHDRFAPSPEERAGRYT